VRSAVAIHSCCTSAFNVSRTCTHSRKKIQWILELAKYRMATIPRTKTRTNYGLGVRGRIGVGLFTPYDIDIDQHITQDE
jgi:hypothetical protein